MDNTVSCGWWNLQNLFDIRGSEIARNFGFTPEKGWTRPVYERKIANLAKAIKTFTPNGPPDILGVCEVENDRVLEDLARATGKDSYDFICLETTDMEGADTAFLYNKDVFEVMDEPVGHTIYTRYNTHDVLEAKLRCRLNGAELVVLANHWPSRRSGRILTEPFRIAVADYCTRIIASHLKLDEKEFEKTSSFSALRKISESKGLSNMILLGDFNDEPFDMSIREYLLAVPNADLVRKSLVPEKKSKSKPSWRTYEHKQPFLYNPTWLLTSQSRPGTYYHSAQVTRWAFLDQVIISRGLLEGATMHFVPESLRVISNGTVATRSGIPRPFSLRKTSSGTSDHLPMVFEMTVD